MICRLCRQDRDLCQSHIFPEFLYERLYDSTHRFGHLAGPDSEKLLHQKGIRERLLCEQCEGRLSRFEAYARRVLFEPGYARVIVDDGDRCVYQVNYTQFKLFELSILWRIAVTNHPHFRVVSGLGRNESRLRQMLLNEDAGSTTDYGCIVSEPKKYQEYARQFISFSGFCKQRKPYKTLNARFMFAGRAWLFLVTRRPLNPGLSAAFLQEDGRLCIQRGDWVDSYLINLSEKCGKRRRPRGL